VAEPLVCPACGTGGALSERFCPRCGSPLVLVPGLAGQPSPREDEAAAVAELFNEISQAAYGAPEANEDEIRLWFSSPEVDAQRDIRVGVAPDGRLAAYCDVSEQGGKVWLDVREHPSIGAGAAKAVVDPLIPRARELAAERGLDPVVLRAWTPGVGRSVAAMLEADGFHVVRHSVGMEIDLEEEPPEPKFPAGVSVRTFREGEERRVFDVQNEGFVDMWEYVPQPYEEWLHFMTGAPDFDPSLWFLAVAGDDVAGLALCRPHAPGNAELGWIRVLCVRPPWRRRGIALALLRHAFRELRTRGRPRAGLGVDAESTTGALELYERAGMRIVRQYDVYEKVLEPR
jgi:ribosomal protein S18 acetylase RimI-like enzyme